MSEAMGDERRLRRRERRRADGFSFLEVLVVLGVFAVIAAMAIPIVPAQLTRTKVDETKAELAAMNAATLAFFQDTGTFPSGQYALYSYQYNITIPLGGGTGQSQAIPGWNGPYLFPAVPRLSTTAQSLLQDAWNTNYTITVVDASHWQLTSNGPDKTAGTADDLSTIVDVTPIRRQQTVDKLKTLNQSIAIYNANNTWFTTLPLTPPLANVLTQLATKGLLPATTTQWLTDGWGDAFVENPLGVTPVTQLVSTHSGS